MRMIASFVRSALKARTVGMVLAIALASLIPYLGTARAASVSDPATISVPELSVTFDRDGPTVSGSIRVTNDSSKTQSGLFMALELIRSGQQLGGADRGGEISNESIGEWTLPDTFTLEGSSTKSFTYEQKLSPLLTDGAYFVTAKVYGPTGVYLASKTESVAVDTANGNRFLETVANTQTVTADGKSYPSLQGPLATGTVRLHLQVRNPHKETIRFAPVVDGYLHTIKPGDKPLITQTGDPVDIAAGATADVTVDFPVGTVPGSHMGILRLQDPATRVQIGPDTEYRWIVAGSSGKLLSLSSSVTNNAAKSTVSASTTVVGPADDSSLDNATLRLTVSNGDKEVASVSSSPFHVGTDSVDQVIDATVTRPLRSYTPEIKVELLSADGSILDTVTGKGSEVASIFSSWVVWTGAGLLIALLAIVTFLVTRRKNKKSPKHARAAAAVAAALLLGGSLLGLSTHIPSTEAAVRPSAVSGMGEVFSKAAYSLRLNPDNPLDYTPPTKVCTAEEAGNPPTFGVNAAPPLTWTGPSATLINDYGKGSGTIGRGQTVVFSQMLPRDYAKNTSTISRFHTYYTLGRIDGSDCSLNEDPPDYGDITCGGGGPGNVAACKAAMDEVNARYRAWARNFTHAQYAGITATSNNEIYYSAYIKSPTDFGRQASDVFPYSFVKMDSNIYSNDTCWIPSFVPGTTAKTEYEKYDGRLVYTEEGTKALIDVDNFYFKQNYGTGTLAQDCTETTQPGSVTGTAYDVDTTLPVRATVKILNSDNLSDVRKSVEVDPSGEYNLIDLPYGTYYVAPVTGSDYKLVKEPDTVKYPKGTNGYKVTLSATARTAQLDFGYQKVAAPLPSTIGGGVYGTDASGAKTTPYAFPGGSVTLTGAGTSLSAYPDSATGVYSFRNLIDGTYALSYTPGTGWNQTVPQSPTTYSVRVSNGQVVNDKDFGAYRPTPCTTASISGSVSGPLSQVKAIKATGTQPGNTGSTSTLTGAGFKITDLKADTYTLAIDLNNTTDYEAVVTPSTVTLAACVDKAGVAITISAKPIPPVSLSGKVTFVILDSANTNYIGTASIPTTGLSVVKKDGSSVPVSSTGTYTVSVVRNVADSLTLSGVDTLPLPTEDPGYTYTPWVVSPDSYAWASASSGGTIPSSADFTLTTTRTAVPGTGSVPNYSTGSRRW